MTQGLAIVKLWVLTHTHQHMSVATSSLLEDWPLNYDISLVRGPKCLQIQLKYRERSLSVSEKNNNSEIPRRFIHQGKEEKKEKTWYTTKIQEILTASLKSPSLGVNVTASSREPRSWSG